MLSLLICSLIMVSDIQIEAVRVKDGSWILYLPSLQEGESYHNVNVTYNGDVYSLPDRKLAGFWVLPPEARSGVLWGEVVGVGEVQPIKGTWGSEPWDPSGFLAVIISVFCTAVGMAAFFLFCPNLVKRLLS